MVVNQNERIEELESTISINQLTDQSRKEGIVVLQSNKPKHCAALREQ